MYKRMVLNSLFINFTWLIISAKVDMYTDCFVVQILEEKKTINFCKYVSFLSIFSGIACKCYCYGDHFSDSISFIKMQYYVLCQ